MNLLRESFEMPDVMEGYVTVTGGTVWSAAFTQDRR
jgi:hypothetical protein